MHKQPSKFLKRFLSANNTFEILLIRSACWFSLSKIDLNDQCILMKEQAFYIYRDVRDLCKLWSDDSETVTPTNQRSKSAKKLGGFL